MKIGVIGLGLIGGSILKALSALNDMEYELCAVSKSSYKKAGNLPLVACASDDVSILKDCDLVFVCSPMSETLDVLDSLKGIVKKETIVCDASSLKNFVCEKKYPYHFIGTHPMAGTEFSGFNASFATLFEGAKWVITEENEILENIIKKMGATPVLCGAKDHDQAVALISHIPMLISFGLCNSIENNKLAQTLASSGFRDATRLAMTNSVLADDMLTLNSENIEKGLEMLIKELNFLKNLPHDEKIRELEKISENRRNMYDGNGKNKTNL